MSIVEIRFADIGSRVVDLSSQPVNGKPMTWIVANRNHFGNGFSTLLWAENLYKLTAAYEYDFDELYNNIFSDKLRKSIMTVQLETGNDALNVQQIFTRKVFVLSAEEMGIVAAEAEGKFGTTVPGLPKERVSLDGVYHDWWTRTFRRKYNHDGTHSTESYVMNGWDLTVSPVPNGTENIALRPAICVYSNTLVEYKFVNEINDYAYVILNAGEHLPAYTKIGGSNKQLIQGYTKINGQLKEVIQGYTKVNGAVKRIF